MNNGFFKELSLEELYSAWVSGMIPEYADFVSAVNDWMLSNDESSEGVLKLLNKMRDDDILTDASEIIEEFSKERNIE